MLQVSQLFIYPVKSLGGIEKDAVQIAATGFTHDRRWMLVDIDNVFLSQRTHPQMALLHIAETVDGFEVFDSKSPLNKITIPFKPTREEKIQVTVWDDDCEAIEVSKRHNEWFSKILQTTCRLVYMPDNARRLVDKRYAGNNEITSFSDGYPILIIGEASLENLNSKLQESLPMNRFRPNIVFSGGHAFIEDELKEFVINDISFFGVKPCARCVMTTINQQNADKGKEPLKTLATYRMKNNKIYFGQNVLHQQQGNIHKGDTIKVIEQGLPFLIG